MVYSSRFVMSVLINGKPVKERADGVVAIPFGHEYAIRFRNKHERRAVVTFTIDGEEASGNGYIIPAHSSVDIMRYAHKDVRFVFVDLESSEAQDFGKNDNPDGSKGVIEAKFFLEKAEPVKPVEIHHHHHHHDPVPINPWPKPYWYRSRRGAVSGQHCNSNDDVDYERSVASDSARGFESAGGASFGFCASPAAPASVTPKSLSEGCTVEGSASGQRFRTVNIELETDFVPLRLVLRGFLERVATATSQEVTHCTQCGAKRSRKNDNFCGACGNKF